MNKLNIEQLNITEEQKRNIKGWLKFTKLKPKFLHIDKLGYLYETGYNEIKKCLVTFRIFQSGLCDMNSGNVNINEFELIHVFK
ncbi:hypothetical protein SIM22_03650 [Bacillus cereus group sp. BfR-BA-01363]|uniref:hypothetical protein n=1 Tax=Bacillus cereus group TaxID=86661 RepID=UPI0011A5F59D|nr:MULTISPECIES: hypothetical protein [Bacillus cereus group]MDX5853220.1 hypothetical protein [Bacillus cereus group sp. BfR-BA-01363]